MRTITTSTTRHQIVQFACVGLTIASLLIPALVFAGGSPSGDNDDSGGGGGYTGIRDMFDGGGPGRSGGGFSAGVDPNSPFNDDGRQGYSTANEARRNAQAYCGHSCNVSVYQDPDGGYNATFRRVAASEGGNGSGSFAAPLPPPPPPRPDLVPQAPIVAVACTEPSQFSTTNVCAGMTVTTQVTNAGNMAITDNRSFPVYLEYRLGDSGSIQQVAVVDQTGGLAAGAQTDLITAVIPDLPIGSYQVRSVVNTPTATGFNESNLANNTSAWTTVNVSRVDPELSVGEFSGSGCDSVTDFDETNLCPMTTTSMAIRNTGGHVMVGERVPYRFDYQLTGQPWVIDADSGVATSGIFHGQNSGVLQGQISGLPIGRHEFRACANTPTSGDFNEVDSSAASNCRTIGFATPPPEPEMTLTPNVELVRQNGTVDLTWTIRAPYTMSCVLRGNVADSDTSFIHVGPTSQNTITTLPLSNAASFAIDCTPAPFPDFPDFSSQTFTANAAVEVIPVVQEI